MIQRIRSFVSRVRHAPGNIDAIEHHLEMLNGHLASLEGRITSMSEDVPALFMTSESSLEQRVSAHIDKAVNASERTAIDRAREYADAANTAARSVVLDASRDHAEALNRQTVELIQAELASIRRELSVVRRIEQPRPPTAEPTAAPSVPPMDPGFYVALEDRFRGDPVMIAERQRVYLPLVEGLVDADHPVLDLGCGRGEWLHMLTSAGIAAMGVDSNPVFVGEVSDAGVSVIEGDLVAHLRSAAPASVGAITMFQVVEHLPFPVLVDVMAECARVLRPGGVLIAETPNALNLSVAATTFWLDPTHERPLHPELLKFIAKQVGFAKVDGWFLNELQSGREPSADPAIVRLVEMIDGPGDFSLLAWT
ncbi:MAG: class I SAM-dependent methyltransferase [Acidimicrobiales bacterium]